MARKKRVRQQQFRVCTLRLFRDDVDKILESTKGTDVTLSVRVRGMVRDAVARRTAETLVWQFYGAKSWAVVVGAATLDEARAAVKQYAAQHALPDAWLDGAGHGCAPLGKPTCVRMEVGL